MTGFWKSCCQVKPIKSFEHEAKEISLVNLRGGSYTYIPWLLSTQLPIASAEAWRNIHFSAFKLRFKTEGGQCVGDTSTKKEMLFLPFFFGVCFRIGLGMLLTH